MNELTQQLIVDRLKFCGCGDPESVLDLLHDFILLTTKHRAEETPKFSSKEWKEYCARQKKEKNDFIKDYSEQVLWLLFYVLDEKEIFTHGGNVSGGWLNDDEFWKSLQKWKIENSINNVD